MLVEKILDGQAEPVENLIQIAQGQIALFGFETANLHPAQPGDLAELRLTPTLLFPQGPYATRNEMFRIAPGQKGSDRAHGTSIIYVTYR